MTEIGRRCPSAMSSASSKRNAPRWIRMLRRYGYIVPDEPEFKAA